MKIISALFLLTLSLTTFSQTNIKVATFDSGFGGYFTAKEIEKQNQELSQTHEGNFSITHYGDTANAPYGEKTPEMIAQYSAAGISKAFDDGAEVVFIACNTASTQYEAIKKILNQKNPGRGDHIISIIESSVQELKRQIDEKFTTKKIVNVAILATPATIRAAAYLQALSEVYKIKNTSGEIKVFSQERWYKQKGEKIESVSSLTTLKFPDGRQIIVSQIGPANWVDMIEHGATASVKTEAIHKDLFLLAPVIPWDVVGEFCTHYPAIDHLLKKESASLGLSGDQTTYIKQGPLMAGIYRQMMQTKLKLKTTPSVARDSRAKIFISGSNLSETADLAREIFPADPKPEISQRSFE